MLRGMVWGLLGIGRTGKAEATGEAADEMGKGNDEPALWTAVFTAYGPVQTKMLILAARLNDEGIAARLRPEAVSSALPLTVGALSRIDLMVPQPMAEKALAILKDLEDLEDVAG